MDNKYQAKLFDDKDIICWKDYMREINYLDLRMLDCLPDFLIISPPKTATTWLSKNLSCHPELFIPEKKEIRYFSVYWRWLDINWYLKHFQEANLQKKGEASPEYAILSLPIIKSIKFLIPDLKLTFLMRDPVDRAWSLAKFNLGFFYDGDMDNVPDEIYIKHFIRELPYAFGDYLSCLKRWLSYFPKEQIYVEFYESVRNNPQRLLLEIFEHIGVSKEVDLSQFPISERVLAGVKKEIPYNLKLYLRSIYQRRTQELAAFLENEFDLVTPQEWTNTLEGDTISYPTLIHKSHREFNIFLSKGNFYAIPQSIEQKSSNQLYTNEDEKNFNYVKSSSLNELKTLIDQITGQTSIKESQKEIMNSKMENFELGAQNDRFSQQQSEFDTKFLTPILAQFAKGIIHTYPLLVEEDYKNFNIILYKGKFIAVSKDLGHVTEYDQDTLREYQNNDQCFSANSLDEVKELINQLSPKLIEEDYWNFNLVRYKGKFFALALTLGPIDLTHLEEEQLVEFQMVNQCFISNSLKDVKDQINLLVDHSYRQTLTEKNAQILSLRQKLSSIKSKLWFYVLKQIKG